MHNSKLIQRSDAHCPKVMISFIERNLFLNFKLMLWLIGVSSDAHSDFYLARVPIL